MAPKHAGGGLRRPAAAKPRQRRPAMREEETEEKDGTKEKIRRFEEVDPRNLGRLGPLRLPEAIYYGRKVELAGTVKGLRCEETQWFLDLEIAGTKDEEILRVLTGRREKVMSVLLCGAECAHQLTDELLVHADRFEEIDLACLPWMTNLKEVRPLIRGEDELAVLRREQAKMEAEKEEMDKKKERKADKRKKRERGRGRRESCKISQEER